jgi:arabinofuranan 3-O-arabinosyltransferase
VSATTTKTSTTLGKRTGLLVHVALALVAYVPFLASSPGDVAADTKQYLYLDPGRLLRGAAYLWDPNVGAGTVLHQNIGYLFPMGPYYWLMDQLGVPDWVAQRLWLGSVTFAAGVGVLFLLRTLRRNDVGAVAAAFVYMLTPYVLAYTARQSVILLPWAGLPWMIALAERSLRNPGWKHPALLALVTFTVGGTNATALLFAGIAPVLWIVFAVAVERRFSARAALAATGRIGVLVAATAAWWVAGLSVQGKYGLPVLDYTETVKSVAAASSPIEVLRGLGNWFFYGRDGLSLWITQSPQYQEQVWLLLATFMIPVLAFVAAAMTRWRHRAYFVALIAVGVVIAVGTYPYNDPSPLGRTFKTFAEGSTVGLAMRSTPRAVPLVALGVAVLLGMGVSALVARRPRVGLTAGVLVAIVAVLGMPPAWSADYVGDNLKRPEDLPQYWLDTAHSLDTVSHDTRVLELPGSDFSSYRWGNTVDPILPGLMDRAWEERELVPFGSQASADLLIALDHRFQEGIAEPDSVAAVARLFAAGDVVVRYDLEYERYRTPRPRLLFASLADGLQGAGSPRSYGPHTPNRASAAQPLNDPLELGTPVGAADPPKVQVYAVKHAGSIVRTAPLTNPVIVAGDGDGLVDAAAAGVIDGRAIVISSAWYAQHRSALRKIVARDADLLVTDTNRRRARHWGASRDMTGNTEQAGEQPLVDDPADHRLTPFPDANDSTRTVAIQRGVKSVQATTYGDPDFLSPEDRPSMAFDGDLRTAWTEGRRNKATGERLVVRFDHPVTTDHVSLVQPQEGVRDRFISDVTLRFDGASAHAAHLSDASRGRKGQTLQFPRRTFSELEVTIDAVDGPAQAMNEVGFAEVRVGAVHVDEVIRLPVDLLRVAGADSAKHRLTFLMTRLRGSQAEYLRTDEEPMLVRQFEVPTARQFALSGVARLDGRAGDDALAPFLDANDLATAGARSSSHLEGDLRARATSAIDGDGTTAWTPAYGPSVGEWVEVERAGRQATTFDHLDLEVVADGRHSVPTQLRITPDDGPAFDVEVPAVTDRASEGATVRVTVQFPQVTARRVRITVAAVRPVTTIEFFSRTAVELPVSIAELGIAGVSTQHDLGGSFSPDCFDNLLTIDDQPVGVRVVGTQADALDRKALMLEPCGDAAAGISLGAGTHQLRAEKGLDTGIDLDRIVLASDAGGTPSVDPLLGQSGGTHPGPAIHVVHEGHVSYDLHVRGAHAPFWLVLAQSHNDGWHAQLADGTDLGPPDLVDGMANAWLVHPGDAHNLSIALRWTPQRRIWLGLGITAIGLLACFVLILRRRRQRDIEADDTAPVFGPLADGGTRASRAVVIGLPIAAAIVGALIAAPWAGVLAGVATLGALLDRRVRTAMRIGSFGALVLAAAYVIFQQARNGYPAAYDWPQRFLRVNELPMLAIVLLAATVAIDTIEERGSTPTRVTRS